MSRSRRICEFVRNYLKDVAVKGAWDEPAALEVLHRALAPVAALPVLEVLGGVHILTAMTLGPGTVVHDDLAKEKETT
jgi:acetoacetate decarboxylase